MFKIRESQASKELKIIYKNMSLRNKILAAFATCTSIFTLAIGAAVIAIITIQPAHAAGMGPNGVPIHSMFDAGGGGDLSHVTRHSFKTGRIINPKTAEANLYNSKLNNMNGYFLTNSAIFKTTGNQTFTVPNGFTKIMIIGCGAGGKGETQTGYSTFSETGGGGAGSCFSIILTKPLDQSSVITFYVANKDVPQFDTQLSSFFGYYHKILGLNGGVGSTPTWWNWVWTNGAAGGGGGSHLIKNDVGLGNTTTSILIPNYIPFTAKLLTKGMDGRGSRGGVANKKIWNKDYTAECHGGRGGDGINLGNTKLPVAAENGCIMILW